MVTSICSALKVNTSKSQIIVQRSSHKPEVPIFTIDRSQKLTIVPHFTYLGSVLSPTCNIDSDIQVCIALLSSGFGRLKSRAFQNRNLTVSTKAAVYKAVCLSTLLYSSEAWTPYQRHISTPEAFHIHCLKGSWVCAGRTELLMWTSLTAPTHPASTHPASATCPKTPLLGGPRNSHAHPVTPPTDPLWPTSGRS